MTTQVKQDEPDNITQQPYDQFSKQFLNELFGPLKSEVKINYEVHADRRYVDVYLPTSPNAPKTDFEALGLLGRMVSSACLLEPFHSPVYKDDIKNCVLKLLMVHSVSGDKADPDNSKADKDKPADKPKKSPKPFLWIIATSVSDAVLDGFAAKPNLVVWGEGVYLLPESLNTGIVAINRLPSTPDTLYLRMLGDGEVQQQAIEEFLALFPQTDPLRQSVLDLLLKYRIYLGDKEKQTELTEVEKELLMNLSNVYRTWEKEAVQRGRQQGRQQGLLAGLLVGLSEEQRLLVKTLLKSKLTERDEELSPVVERMLNSPPEKLPPEELSRLLLQASREDLGAKFSR
jgi:hypothetical protein